MQHAATNQHDHENAYLLGEWQVFPDSGVLIKAGYQIRAEPIVMSVLECLLQSGGRLVTRDELIDKVWAHVVVNDEVLTRAISELRTLLGDVSRERRYIVTIPKRGYRLVMPVLPLAAPVDNRRLPSRLVALTGYLTLASTFAFLFWTATSYLNNHENVPTHRADLEYSAPNENLAKTLHAELQHFQVSGALFGSVDWPIEHTMQSVLVSPLTAITDDEQTHSFAAGLTEDLRHTIFRQTDLKVVYQLPENHLESVLILSGSVRIHDQLTRVNLQLVDAVTSRLLWSSSFDCPLDALLSVQTQIARQAGRHLQQSLTRQA